MKLFIYCVFCNIKACISGWHWGHCSLIQDVLRLFMQSQMFVWACMCAYTFVCCTCVCVYLLVKVGVCESCCVQLWSRWRRPPAPSLSFIFLPPSFTRSPRHTNNLQLGQPWLTLRLHFIHTHAHTEIRTLPPHIGCMYSCWCVAV